MQNDPLTFTNRFRLTGYNLQEETITAYTPVEILSKALPGGDDFGFSVAPARSSSKLFGICQSSMYPTIPVPVVMGGISAALLPDFVLPGDTLKPGDNGSWEVCENGPVQVLASPDADGLGLVMLKTQASTSSLMVLEDVPFNGAGCATGREVIKINSDGSLVLSDTTRAVNLPVLS